MKQKENTINTSSGNALIYVLIAIALFAALGFTLSRQTHNAGTGEIDAAKADIYAAQFLTYATQAKSVIDQMMFTGSNIDDLDFTLPSEAGFNVAPHIHKVYHPEGGGLTPNTLPAQTINQVSTPPDAGWYMGRFNNVEWTSSTGSDVILTAHQISKSVCEAIDEAITGSLTLPILKGNLEDFLVDSATDTDLTVTDCANCEGYMTLCIRNAADTAYSFYTILADR